MHWHRDVAMNVGLARELGVAFVGSRHEVATGLAIRPDFVDCLGFTWAKIWAAVGLHLGYKKS